MSTISWNLGVLHEIHINDIICLTVSLFLFSTPSYPITVPLNSTFPLPHILSLFLWTPPFHSLISYHCSSELHLSTPSYPITVPLNSTFPLPHILSLFLWTPPFHSLISYHCSSELHLSTPSYPITVPLNSTFLSTPSYPITVPLNSTFPLPHILSLFLWTPPFHSLISYHCSSELHLSTPSYPITVPLNSTFPLPHILSLFLWTPPFHSLISYHCSSELHLSTPSYPITVPLNSTFPLPHILSLFLWTPPFHSLISYHCSSELHLSTPSYPITVPLNSTFPLTLSIPSRSLLLPLRKTYQHEQNGPLGWLAFFLLRRPKFGRSLYGFPQPPDFPEAGGHRERIFRVHLSTAEVWLIAVTMCTSRFTVSSHNVPL